MYKIYRHETNRKIGVKFDDYRKLMVQVTARGSLETAVRFSFSPRKGVDFNADSRYRKDYNAEIHEIIGELLGIDNDLRQKRFLTAYAPNTVEVSIVDDQSNGVGIGNYEETVERLISRLRATY